MKNSLSFTFIVSAILLSMPINVLADKVSKSSFNGVWPLTVKEGTLACDNNAVTFKTKNGKVYAVNGVAGDRGAQPIDPIWANNPELPGAKLSISDLLKQGLSLCSNKAGDKTVPAPSAPEQPTNKDPENWFDGGTLHRAKGKDWRTATDTNRLATSADIITKLSDNGKLAFTIQDLEELKSYSTGLSNCLTEFLKTEQTDALLVAEAALLCMTTMKWLKVE